LKTERAKEEWGSLQVQLTEEMKKKLKPKAIEVWVGYEANKELAEPWK
jgi:hypothetical protein